MELEVTGAGALKVSDKAFGAVYNEALIHQTVVAFLAGSRQGTKAQKNRSAVSGGGAKPWRQKGTGRARAGTIRSPIWRSGGKTFAAKPQDHSHKLNKKMYRGAMCSILSELARSGRLVVVEDFIINEPKTKQMIERLGQLKVSKALIITGEVDQNLYLSARNIPHVDVRDVIAIDPVSLIAHESVVMTVEAVKKFEEMLG